MMIVVAVSRKKNGAGWFLFWLVFIIGIVLLFMLNRERIKATLEKNRVLELLRGEAGSEQELTDAGNDPAEPDTSGSAPRSTPVRDASPSGDEALLSVLQELAQAERADGKTGTADNGETAQTPVSAKAVERLVYLMKADNSGTILWSAVKRKIPASDKPMQDALNVLIRGPSAEEEKQGLISLIPRNVQIQHAVVRGNTAYISFNENFLFNTYGVEGYIGQRRQVVLTATEFSNVRDVQILIDGKRIDYLGEGIWIGSPISRDML